MNLRVMRSHDPTIGLRVMRNDPMMNLRVMRSQDQNRARNSQLLRTANNMNMRIMLRNDPDVNMDMMRMRRSSGANNSQSQKTAIDRFSSFLTFLQL